ncbi:hypothetical protein [Agromyces humi]|uniref:hypothetical protein n=1 Tax=Agromyces humi TaxID=1766800 RepID=UPI00135C9680|nr:hypothetical protein [Agromyces humi]
MLLLATAACSSPISSTAGSSVDAVADVDAANAAALAVYVQAEQATIPQILGQYPDLYSEVTIDGAMKDQAGDRGLPAGTYAVVFYDYTYASAVDWPTAIDALDGQRASFDSVCDSTVFPAMRQAGVTGPLSAVYSYTDGRSEFGPMWSHTCSDY